MPTKKKPKKRTNVGLKAARISPLTGRVSLSALRRVNRRTLAIVAAVVVIGGGYLFYRGTHAGSFFPATIKAGYTFTKANGQLQSANNAYFALLQGDGNFVLYRQSDLRAMWSTATGGKGGTRMVYQSDGNLVLYNAAGGIVWHSHSQNLGGNHLTLRDDGNMINYTSTNTPIWSSVAGICKSPVGSQYYYPERTDRGVDYQMNHNASVYAPCSGKIISTIIPGWGHNNAYITLKLTSYPFGHPELLGKCLFFAEDMIPNVAIGNTVYAGDKIATVQNLNKGDGYPNGQLEWGWSYVPGTPSSPKAANDGTTPGGRAMARFLRHLGMTTREDPGPGPWVDGTPCS